MRARPYLSVTLLTAFTMIGFVRPAIADNGNDRVSFGSRIVVDEGETAGDVVCFFCSVEAHGKINGDVVTFLGNVRSSNEIQGDVVAFAGNVNLDDEATVAGDLVIFGGTLRKAANTQIRQEQVIFPFVIFFIPILIVIGLIWLISGLFRRRRPIFYIPPAR